MGLLPVLGQISLHVPGIGNALVDSQSLLFFIGKGFSHPPPEIHLHLRFS